MNIGLLNLEPKYKNLALEKLRIYHQLRGDYTEHSRQRKYAKLIDEMWYNQYPWLEVKRE